MTTNNAIPSWGQAALVSIFTAATVLAVQCEGTALAGPSSWEKREPQQVDTTRADGSPPTGSVTDAGKHQLYMRTKQSQVVHNASGHAQAKCADADDIPVAGACHTSGDARNQSSRMNNWTTNKQPAEYECVFFNDSGAIVGFEAQIVCMRYVAGS